MQHPDGDRRAGGLSTEREVRSAATWALADDVRYSLLLEE